MKLVKGAGSPKTGACWMSALNFYVTNGATWTDQPPCVPPIIRQLCIRLNDWLSDGERETMIGPHLFAPVGADPSQESEQKRAFLCADMAVRVWAPRALRARGCVKEAQLLELLPEIVNVTSARNAANASAAAYAASAAANAAAYAAADAAAAANAAAYAAANASGAAAKQELLDLILRCCAIGSTVPVETACSRADVLCMLER